ncbi:Uncharacterized protein TCM_013988 [Theobroma cacao]|uniref:Reverse transcriptase zinc-binding domain-containing protein n=1 Tax=Theobroma cacao TaxID=3641 RepID=A0A061FXQ5_THECC|nr:Uncharacterized protein TCM_013988 [Theobroma cacao]
MVHHGLFPFDIPRILGNHYLNEILSFLALVIISVCKRDRLIWTYDDKGNFFIKTSTSIIDKGPIGQKVWCHSLWKLPIPPKVQGFIWLAILDSILSKTFLASQVSSNHGLMLHFLVLSTIVGSLFA